MAEDGLSREILDNGWAACWHPVPLPWPGLPVAGGGQETPLGSLGSLGMR